MYMLVHVAINAMEATSKHWVSYFATLHPISSRMGLLMNLGLGWQPPSLG